MNKDNNRILIVEDSSFMCQLYKVLLAKEKFILEFARNGKEAIEKARTFQPKVITMDIEMPVMSGIEAMSVIMAERPVPVIMVSALTMRGAEVSVRALSMGAFDVVTKPAEEAGLDVETFQRELITKIKVALLVPPEKLNPNYRLPSQATPGAQTVSGSPRFTASPFAAVLIGTSTGGPTALQNLLTPLAKDFPAPILVAQHMPQNFTKLMAERLNNLCQLQVKEAEDGDQVLPGRVLIAPGGLQMSLVRTGNGVVTRILKESPFPTPYKPSVNVLFKSAAEAFGSETLALVLTGMGSDGLEGCVDLKKKGAKVVAESEETCIVYGMAKCVVEAGLADKVLPLPQIARFLVDRFTEARGV